MRSCRRCVYQQPQTVLFSARHPLVSPPDPGSTLYIPTNYHYRGVDAIFLSFVRTSSPPKASIVGIQITIAKCHSDSETLFFQDWQRWVEKLELPAENVSFRFLWVYEDICLRPPLETMPEINKILRGSEKLSRPAFTRMVAANSSISPDIGHQLRVVRGL